MRLLHQLVALEVLFLYFPSPSPLCPPKTYSGDGEVTSSVDVGSEEHAIWQSQSVSSAFALSILELFQLALPVVTPCIFFFKQQR